MSVFNEFTWIDSLPQSSKPELKLGIGDDAAIFQSSEDWAVSTDSLIEGSHFNPSDKPFNIAKKLVNVNVSDMAAMGCQPKFFLLNLHLSPNWNEKQLNEFKDGLIKTLQNWDIALIGGDTVTCKEGPTHLVGTILGQPYSKNAILRSGAKLDDDIYITGELGGSFPHRHLTFEPRLDWSKELCLSCSPSAMMDVSDGLLQDLGHILDESRVSAELELEVVPIHQDAMSNTEPLINALSDGEDFELLFTLPASQSNLLPKNIPVTKIGKIISGESEIFARKFKTDPLKVWPRLGFEHNHSSHS